MKQYPMSKIRNVCVMGHGGAGKTSFTESCLFKSKAIERLGKIADGNTASDFDSEEIKRQISVSTALVPVEYNGCKINFIDTPGYFDFVGEVKEGVKAADSAVIIVSGKSGVSVGTENAWNYSKEEKIPSFIFVNKMDDENANYFTVVEQLRDVFGKSVVPFQAPIKENGKIIGFVNIVDMEGKKTNNGVYEEVPVPDDLAEQLAPYREMIVESVAETSDDLMEKYFAGEEFTKEEIHKALQQGVEDGEISPIFSGSAQEVIGIRMFMDAIVEFLPAPDQSAKRYAKAKDSEEPIELKIDENGPLCALVFKTVADPYVGKLSYFKVFSGAMKPDSTVLNANKGSNEKIGRLFTICGKKQMETDKVIAGDIGAVTKLANTSTGDTLCSSAKPLIMEGPQFPSPNLSMAILPKAKGDEEKISSGLHKLMDEDPTFKVSNNTETHQTIISGLGEQHLDIISSKLKNKFGVDMDVVEPRVAYRETIRKKVKVEGKHKKQSGGHGQYGHVWIEFEPNPESEDLVFEEKIFGGAVPKNYFPAVEKGLRESITKGVLAGYPVVNLKATLVDGSYHPVDSSEMAFKVAASLAYKKGMEEASSVLLEPIGHLEVLVPDSYMGDVIGDINKRRGRVLGMNPGNLTAEVPMAEMHKYATDLRSMTQGRGSFTFAFERYEEAPANVAQKVIEESKKEHE